jgi:hypothetical protein
MGGGRGGQRELGWIYWQGSQIRGPGASTTHKNIEKFTKMEKQLGFKAEGLGKREGGV